RGSARALRAPPRRPRAGRPGGQRRRADPRAGDSRIGAGRAGRGLSRPGRGGGRAGHPGTGRKGRARRRDASSPARVIDGLLNVDDFEAAARERLEPGVYGYIAGGAGDEQTLSANAAAFAWWELRPRVLVDVGSVSTATT